MMAIRRKPSTVDEFISGGSTVPGTQEPSISETQVLTETPKTKGVEEETITVTLRIPGDLLAEVNVAGKKRRPRCSRNSWILEAIIEKLESEGKKLD